jgi:hypothetical protein
VRGHNTRARVRDGGRAIKFWLIQPSRSRRSAGTSCWLTASMPILHACATRAAHRLISKCSTLACRSLRCVKALAKPVRRMISRTRSGIPAFGILPWMAGRSMLRLSVSSSRSSGVTTMRVFPFVVSKRKSGLFAARSATVR